MKKKHFATVSQSGEIHFSDIVAWKQEALNHKGQRVNITMEKQKKHRSGGQNRYAHGVVFPMMAECMGCEMEEAKDALKFEFLRKQLDCGKWTTRQTSSLTTVEFEEFLSKCRMLASQMFNCYVPEPHETEY
jgi:hypothetical protein